MKNILLNKHKLFLLIKAIRLLLNKNLFLIFLKTKRKDNCLDIGANIGDVSLVMWLKGAKVLALEPHPEAFKKLKSRTSILKNISSINMAICSENCIQKLYLHENIINKSDKKNLLALSKASSLKKEKDNLNENYFEVKGITIFELLKNQNFKPNLIKCDIEGSEYEIYQDLIEIAKQDELRIIYLECHSKKYKRWANEHKKMLDMIYKNNLKRKFNLNWH